MTGQLLKISEVMKRLNVSRRTVYYWIEKGILKPIRIGGVYRFHPFDINELIESGGFLERKKILAVDDDVLVRESIKSLLGRAGYSVTVVPDGKMAVSISKQEDFDLILTDMRMPGMDGIETLKAIRGARKESGRESAPEIIITAYDDSKAKKEAEMIGVNDFLIKPFELDYFLDLIKRKVS